jgi:hypothetical protein
MEALKMPNSKIVNGLTSTNFSVFLLTTEKLPPSQGLLGTYTSASNRQTKGPPPIASKTSVGASLRQHEPAISV